MANVKIMAKAFVLTSGLKMEDLKKIKQFHPENLVLKDEKTKDDVFCIEIGKVGDIKPYGICFDGVDNNGFANITRMFPDGLALEDRQKYITEKVGGALLKLNAFETTVAAHVSALTDELNNIASNVTVVD